MAQKAKNKTKKTLSKKKAAKKTVVKKTAPKKVAAKPVKKSKAKAKKAQTGKKTGAPKKALSPQKAAVKKVAKKSGAKAGNAKNTSKTPGANVANKNKISPIKIHLQELITPLDDRLIVEEVAGEKMTAGGLYIPDTAQVSGNKKGKIRAAGRGHKDSKGRLRPLDVRVGDTIVFSEFSGSKLELLGQTYLILRETDILGVVEN